MMRPDQPADRDDPLEERRRIEEAYTPLPVCPRCHARVPAWAMEVIDEGHGRICLACAANLNDIRGEVY
jgi:hypothetical protein